MRTVDPRTLPIAPARGLMWSLLRQIPGFLGSLRTGLRELAKAVAIHPASGNLAFDYMFERRLIHVGAVALGLPDRKHAFVGRDCILEPVVFCPWASMCRTVIDIAASKRCSKATRPGSSRTSSNSARIRSRVAAGCKCPALESSSINASTLASIVLFLSRRVLCCALRHPAPDTFSCRSLRAGRLSFVPQRASSARQPPRAISLASAARLRTRDRR